MSVIARIQTYPLEYQEPNNDGKTRSVTLVSIETDDGAIGWGEAITGDRETSLLVSRVVERRLAPLVLDGDPSGAVDLWQAMRDATFWDGNGGLVTFGISAVDMAIWDLRGRISGRSLANLLGGRVHDRLRACASTIFATNDLERVAREFAGFKSMGYSAVKGGWGHDLSTAFGLDFDRDLQLASTVREAVGPAIDVICDVVALAGWSAEYGMRFARRAHAEIGLYWLEDPFAEDQYAAYQTLKSELPELRVCTGEKGWTAPHYDRLLDTGVDVVMLDPGRVEGVSGAWRIISRAAARGRAWNAHSWSSVVNSAASIQLAAASTNVLLMELKPVPSPMQDDITTTPIRQHDGYIEVPEGPGLGIEIDQVAVRSFIVTE